MQIVLKKTLYFELFHLHVYLYSYLINICFLLLKNYNFYFLLSQQKYKKC